MLRRAAVAQGSGLDYADLLHLNLNTMWTSFGNPCEGIQAVGRPGE